MGSGHSRGPAGAAEARKSFAPIYPIENAIKVDGNVTDWEWAPSLGIGKFAFPISIAEHGTVARFLARYDAEYFYAAFRVTDSSPALNKLSGPAWDVGQCEWRDKNGDGLPQLDEYRLHTKQETKPFWRTASPHNYYVDAHWNIQNKVDEGPEGRYIRRPMVP